MAPTPARKILLNCAIDLFDNGAQADSLAILRRLAQTSEQYIPELPDSFWRAMGVSVESTQ